MKNENKRKLTKKEIALCIVFSFAFMVSLCIFNQFDVLFQNQVEFGIQPQEIFLVFGLFSLITWAVCFGALFVSARFSKLAFKIILAVLLGFMLASYAQVLFLNKHYNGLFEDFAGKFKPINTFTKVFNLIVWLIIFLLPPAVLLLEKHLKKNFFKKIAVLGAVVILAMQLVGLATAIPNAEFRRYDYSFYFSVDKQLELSKPSEDSENVVVFILDRAAIAYVDEVFEDNPETKDTFDGFTYYRNNTAQYEATFPSLVSMLTGKDFEETQTREVFTKDAWKNAVLFDELKERGYTVNALLDELSTYYDSEDVLGNIDNYLSVENKRTVNQGQALKAMNAMAFQRTLPYVLKKMAGFNYPRDLDRIVENLREDYFPTKIGANSDKIFEQKVSNVGLSTSNSEKTFSFVHLNCSHNNFGWRNTTVATFKMLGEYFNQMKELGIFDNSTIILSADHGAAGYGNEGEGRKCAVFIKEKGESDKDEDGNKIKMRTNSDAKLSNGYFLSTIFEVIGAEDKKPVDNDGNIVPSYFDVIHKGATADRVYYNLEWNVGNRCKFINKILLTD